MDFCNLKFCLLSLKQSMFDFNQVLVNKFFHISGPKSHFPRSLQPFPLDFFLPQKSFSQATSIGMDRGVSVTSAQAIETILEN